MLACDWYEDDVKFPCIAQPKIDGVHALNQQGVLLGRSLKKHRNKYITELFSKPEYNGFCGEMISGADPTAQDLCRVTSGDLSRITGEPKVKWYLFDYCTESTYNMVYSDRMKALRYFMLNNNNIDYSNVEIIESVLVHSMDELKTLEDKWLNEGYEGVILRDQHETYKFGRCGKTHMGAWRIKNFIDAEILVTELEEGNSNQNEAKINELGRTERSSHQENKVPNGMIGNIKGVLLKDIIDVHSKNVLVKRGTIITVAPGSLTEKERKFYFENQGEILSKIVKFKFFPKGIKDKPRFSTFLSIRSPEDM